MRRITDRTLGYALAAFMAALAIPLAAQGAYVAGATIVQADGEPSEYLYRLEIAYKEGRPGIEPKVGFDDAPGKAVATSVLVKPFGKERSEVVIRFNAPQGGAPSFPGITLSWMAERLVVPPRALDGGSETNGGKSSGIEKRDEPEENGKETWRNAVLPAGYGSARAVGVFASQATIDRDRASPGDTAYVEFRLDGSGDFARARPPSLLLVSGKATLGNPRRYPGYDAESGKGSLLFRFPLRIDGEGTLRLEVGPYPVYDAEARLFHPGEAKVLSLRVETEDAHGGAEHGMSLDAGKKGESGNRGRILLVLCIAASGAILAGFFVAMGIRATKRRMAIHIVCAVCSASLAMALAVFSWLKAGTDGQGRTIVVSAGNAIYAVPSLEARSWRGDGTEARISGEISDEYGNAWLKIVFWNSREGWILKDDSGKP